MASSLPSLQVRKGSAVNEFLGRLIEKMAEVGTRSSMTSNTRLIISEGRFEYLAFEPLFSLSCYRVGPAITFHAVYKQMKCMHKQGVGERSEPHFL